MENCRSLKFRVQDLFNVGLLNFKEANPYVGTNPVPGYKSPSTNAVEEDVMGPLKMRVKDMETSLSFVFKEMRKFWLIEQNLEESFACPLQLGANHSIDECDTFKKTLEDLMDRYLIQVGHRINDKEVTAADRLALKPLVVH